MREGNTLPSLSRVNEVVVYLLLRYVRYGGASGNAQSHRERLTERCAELSTPE